MEPNENIDNNGRLDNSENLSDLMDVIKHDIQMSHLPQSSSSPSFIQQQQQFIQIQKQQPPLLQQLEQAPQCSNQSKRPLKPYIKIVEQPAGKTLRFRYICEGRSAGSIPGANSTPENKTFPTIEIVGCKGDIAVVVSCVTKDPPYRPHPHNVVGKECKNGICTISLNAEPYRAVFSNLGIQCIKKRDIKAALEVREEIKVDPFKTRFGHKDQPSSIDLNVVRLCFQAFMKTPSGPKPLTAVVSDPIYDKKSVSDLVICRLCSCAAKVNGGDEIILLCEKVNKDDIKVRFFETNSEGDLLWEAYAEFQTPDIHKNTAIAFKTPRYRNTDIVAKVQVYLQLVRPSDGLTSEPMEFDYFPDPGMRTFSRIQRKLKRKQDLEIFQQILSLDSETTATKYSCPPLELDDDNETVTSESDVSKPHSSDTLNEFEEVVKQHQTDSEITDKGEEDYDRDEDEDDENDYNKIIRDNMEIELEVPQIHHPAADESTQTSTPMEEILKHQQLDAPRQLSAADKITEWMRSTEFERTDSLTVENGDTASLEPVTVFTNVSTDVSANNNHTTVGTLTDDDKTFTDLMEQLGELDDAFAVDAHSRRDTLDNPNVKELPLSGLVVVGGSDYGDSVSELLPTTIEAIAAAGSASTQASVDIDDNFDETSTYTSLQIAFKNPIEIPINDFNDHYNFRNTASKSIKDVEEGSGLVVLTNPPAPRIQVNAAQTPPSPPRSSLTSLPTVPPRTPSPGPDQQLPPLPPKRKASQELGSSTPTPSSNAIERPRNGSITSMRPPSQIIIMRTPDQSPTKRPLTASPPTSATSSPKKRQGFFSRLFSRRKSRSDMQLNDDEANSKSGCSKATSPSGSREPSIGHFSLADPNRSSMRSNVSLQPPQTPQTPGLSPQNSTNSNRSNNNGSGAGKAVGRSASSVSGKRPAYLNADVIHIPLKGGDSSNSLHKPEGYSNASTITFGTHLDRRTLSALHLADIPICDGNMELVAIADRQSIKNLCEGAYGVVLDPSVDLGEAEHFALYTSIPPTQANDVGDASSASYYGQLEASQILSADEIARRLAEANGLQRKRLKTGGMNDIRMEVQKHLQQTTQFPNNLSNILPNSNANFWNTPDIKTEPAMSPQNYGSHRSPYHLSPSPQPPSPLDRTAATPSPGVMTHTLCANNQAEICGMFNASSISNQQQQQSPLSAYGGVLQQPAAAMQYQNANFNPFLPNGNGEICDESKVMNIGILGGIRQNSSTNPFVDQWSRAPSTSGGSITPIYNNNNTNNNNINNNMGVGFQTLPSVEYLKMNIMPPAPSALQQQQQPPQQLQQNGVNIAQTLRSLLDDGVNAPQLENIENAQDIQLTNSALQQLNNVSLSGLGLSGLLEGDGLMVENNFNDFEPEGFQPSRNG